MMTRCLVAVAAFSVMPAFGGEREPVKEFGDRIADYLNLRKTAVSNRPKLKTKAEPEEIVAHKRAEAKAIRAARKGASQGDIFSPAIQEYIKEAIHIETRGREGAPAKEATKQGNPAVEGDTRPLLKVNAEYPQKAPLSTVPADLLLRLPELPKELGFRFVGKNLVLLDVNASLIVDFIPNAIQ